MSEKTLTLPRLDETIEEGTVLAWSKIAGENFDRGDILLELETDKMVVEVPALEDGTLLEILAHEGSKILIGAPIARIEAPSGERTSGEPQKTVPEDKPAPEQFYENKNRQPETFENEASSSSTPPSVSEKLETPGLRASPGARRLAAQQHLKLDELLGTGPLGRITRQDIEQTLSAPPAALIPQEKASVTMVSEESESSIETDGLNISYLRKGLAGRTPLVFFHGFGGDLNSWRFNLSLLEKQREVWALDLPGHGESWTSSTAPERFRLGIDELAEDISQFLMLAGLDRVHLIGHSLGGGIALSLAASHPERVASLVLLAPVGLGTEINQEYVQNFIGASGKAELNAALHRLFYHGSWVKAALIEPLEQQRLEPLRTEALMQMASSLHEEGCQRWQGRNLFERLPMPVKVIWGREDLVIPSDHAAGLPGTVAVHLFRETGHMAHIEQAMAVNRLIKELCAFE